LFDGRRATGVEIERDGTRTIVHARRETVLACGAYGSPQLLQLSGIGDAAALQRLGIEPIVNLASVGKNLHDHPAASVAMRTANTDSYGLSWRTVPRSALIAARYLLFRSGPLASNVFEANGFMRSRPDVERPDLQIIFVPAHRNANGHWLPRGHGYGIIFVNLRPASRGSVTLTSKDPHEKPAIDFNFLAVPGDSEVLVRGFEVARSILAAPAFAALDGREILPGQEVHGRAAIEAYIRKTLVTVHHACGTCRIGDVVDSSLRVKGIEALRVVDGSVIPTVIAGNSNIPVNAVAERAADLILGKPPPAAP
jgi:choline dehydrogenase-like flavoprotein